LLDAAVEKGSYTRTATSNGYRSMFVSGNLHWIDVAWNAMSKQPQHRKDLARNAISQILLSAVSPSSTMIATWFNKAKFSTDDVQDSFRRSRPISARTCI